MARLRLRYQNGQFIAIDPLPQLLEGTEIEVEWTPPAEHERDEIDEMLDRTRGLWADWDGIEEILQDSRDKWDQSWQDNLPSL